MKIKLYFSVDSVGHDDSVVIEGLSVEDIREKADSYFESRGLVGTKVITGQEWIEGPDR